MSFSLGITLVLTIGSLYAGASMISHWPWAKKHKALVWTVFALFIALEVLTFFFLRKSDTDFWGRRPFLWSSFAVLGLFTCLFIYAVFIDAATLLPKIFNRWKKRPEANINLSRRSFFTVGTLTLGSSTIGVAQTALGPQVYEVDIPLQNLPPEFDGFKIAQISDLHVGPTIGRNYTENIVRIVNDLSPDLVALTGDFVDGPVSLLGQDTSPLANLKSPYGSYFVTGNHEYYSGVDQWIEEFKRLGARVLLNEHVRIEKGSSHFILAGVTDYRAGSRKASHESSPAKAIEGASADSVKVLLAHQPSSYKDAASAGYDLQISGHTHGGQFFPWSLAVQLAHRYYKGLNRHDNMWIYVNRGTGYWGPPLRFTVPAEVTLIRLRQA